MQAKRDCKRTLALFSGTTVPAVPLPYPTDLPSFSAVPPNDKQISTSPPFWPCPSEPSHLVIFRGTPVWLLVSREAKAEINQFLGYQGHPQPHRLEAKPSVSDITSSQEASATASTCGVWDVEIGEVPSGFSTARPFEMLTSKTSNMWVVFAPVAIVL